MFTIKNAIKNIYRYKNKYVLFGVLFLILILSASVCVNIFVRMEQITDNLIREYAGVSVLTRGITGDVRYTKGEYLRFMDIEHIDDIKFFKYNFASYFMEEDAAAVETDLHIGGEVRPLIGRTIIGIPNVGSEVYVFGYNMSLLHLAAEHFKIERGRMFENDGECVIAKNSMYINDLRIYDEDTDTWSDYRTWVDLDLGDKIVVKNDGGMYKEFTVVGIQAQDPHNDENTNRRMIYTTLEGAEYFDAFASRKYQSWRLSMNEEWPSYGNPVWHYNPLYGQVHSGYDVLAYLNSPENFASVRKELEAMDIMIEPWFANFGLMRQLVMNMQSWSIAFVTLTAFVLVSLMIAATAILLNSRKYEMAVLRSAGMTKGRLILGYLVEKLAFIWGITAISLILAPIAAGPFIGGLVGGMREYVSPEVAEKLAQGADLGLMLQNIGIVFAGATGVVALSLILACVNIVRFEPLKIFNKQY